MKLSSIIKKIDNQEFFNDDEFLEVKKRTKQIKIIQGIDEIKVVYEVIGNCGGVYFVDTEYSFYDLIEQLGLTEQVETGHVVITEL